MINNPQIAEHIENLIPFRAFSVAGFFNQSGTFSVWSYATAILEVKPDKELIFFNNLYYSPTTSKVQNIICELLELPHRRNKRIYSQGDLKKS